MKQKKMPPFPSNSNPAKRRKTSESSFTVQHQRKQSHTGAPSITGKPTGNRSLSGSLGPQRPQSRPGHSDAFDNRKNGIGKHTAGHLKGHRGEAKRRFEEVEDENEEDEEDLDDGLEDGGDEDGEESELDSDDGGEDDEASGDDGSVNTSDSDIDEGSQRGIPEDEYSDEQDSGSDDDDGDSEVEAVLKQELSSVPFGTLVKVQSKLAQGRYSKASTRGSSGSVPGDLGVDERSRRDKSSETKSKGNSGKSTKDAALHTKEKKGKNQPAELPSNRPVSRMRKVVPVVGPKPLDPRFSPHTGTLHMDMVRKSYAFVEEARKGELAQLKKAASKAKGEEKDKLKRAVESLENRSRALEAQRRREDIRREWRKKQEDRVKKGGKPFFLKKSDLKRIEAVEKFKSLSGAAPGGSSGASNDAVSKKVDRYLEKRRKKNRGKERVKVPTRRGVGVED
ncbi:DUF947-domain-containing protein [Gonapodya prolifera JEL478]|uniref:rRNA biogenesis protein RRP36 n=1 Tax=Gonapodya prolifera (strain JEL478) TaxID=1344416 RepID=A0A139ALM5_GONPJ|nr:DUF947-domain-containing protein [Gonapodya prolifera JEL478]|eukprot:KXS17687.1 DUF947-domain-containing protein [Gonapodya prolifera JEL478]